MLTAKNSSAIRYSMLISANIGALVPPIYVGGGNFSWAQ